MSYLGTSGSSRSAIADCSNGNDQNEAALRNDRYYRIHSNLPGVQDRRDNHCGNESLYDRTVVELSTQSQHTVCVPTVLGDLPHAQF